MYLESANHLVHVKTYTGPRDQRLGKLSLQQQSESILVTIHAGDSDQLQGITIWYSSTDERSIHLVLVTSKKELVAVYVGTVHVREGSCLATCCTGGCCYQLISMSWIACSQAINLSFALLILEAAHDLNMRNSNPLHKQPNQNITRNALHVQLECAFRISLYVFVAIFKSQACCLQHACC